MTSKWKITLMAQYGDVGPRSVTNPTDPGQNKKAGLIAWMIIVVSFLSLYFSVLNPNDEMFSIYMILGLSLVFGLAGLAAFDIEIDLSFNGQLKVLAEGLLGGLAIVVMQLVVSMMAAVLQAYFSATPLELALMAPAPEELIFTMIIFGTLRSAMPGLPWPIAAIPSSTIFALFHYWAYSVHLIITPILFIGGMIHAYLYERTNDIGTSMTSHMVVNGAPLMFAAGAIIMDYLWVGVVIIAVYIIFAFMLRRK